MQAKAATYTIHLPQFEGPFDLLLFFIERDELDIHNIPIASITEDFLDYIRKMEEMNIDLASEFILVAATLMKIKARMLIPRKQLDEQGNEIDPRTELVERLLEYKRYKSIVDDMAALEEDRHHRTQRGNIISELKSVAEKALVDIELESLSLFKLLKAFEKVMEQFETEKKRTVHKVYNYSYTVESQKLYLMDQVRPGKQTSFVELFQVCVNRIHAIVTFLAILELINQQLMHITLGEEANSFWLTLPEEEAPGPAEEDILPS